MKALLLSVALCLSATAVLAADPTTPVKEVINVTAGNWASDDADYQDVFSEDRLGRIFSSDFAHAYREASKHPMYDLPEGETTGTPFDHDPITGGQDGCPLEDIRVEDDGDGQVTALFKNTKCFGSEAEYQKDTVLIFHVQVEKGSRVIDDIYRVVNFESGKSMKEELKEIGAQ